MATSLEGINAEVVGANQLARIFCLPSKRMPPLQRLPCAHQNRRSRIIRPLPVPLFTVRVCASGLLSTPMYGLIQPGLLTSGPLKPVEVFPSTALSHVEFGSFCHEPECSEEWPGRASRCSDTTPVPVSCRCRLSAANADTGSPSY